MSRRSDRTGDLPLFRWGDELRAARDVRRRLRRRIMAIAALTLGLAATIALPPRPMLLWNASASSPIGLYAVAGSENIAPGDTVIARVPEPYRLFAAGRHYIPANVPLVKRVAAAPSDTVCALGREIFVNGRWVAERRVTDGHRRPMPWWNGCTTLGNGALFLLMDNPASFDGRYFGPTARGDIVGKAALLWRR